MPYADATGIPHPVIQLLHFVGQEYLEFAQLLIPHCNKARHKIMFV